MGRVDWTTLRRRERAASALTYGLIVGLVAVGSIGAVQSVGDSVTALFGGVAEDLGGTGQGNPGAADEDSPPPTPNQAPSLTVPTDETIPQDTATVALPVVLADAETAPAVLVLTATSDNQTLVPDGTITLGGSDENRTVTVTPVPGEIGTARITLTVTDEAGDTASASFQLTVLPREVKLTAADAQADDAFGWSVAVDGDTAVIGAYLDDNTGGVNAGAAYVFTRSGSTWTQQQKLTSIDVQEGDQFGISVAVDGDTAMIGAWREDTGGGDAGAAYVFTRNGGNWTQQQRLTAEDAQSGDRFGAVVAMDGDTAVIGAPFKNAQAGAAYVFTRAGGTWTEQQKLTVAEAGAGERFGGSVAVAGDTIVIGADGFDAGGSSAGAAYVFTADEGSWTEQQKLTAGDASADDYFGFSVAVDGDTAVIGAFGEDTGGSQAGAAYVFTRSGSTWTEQQKLMAGDPGAGDRFGIAVAVRGDTVLVGAYAEDTGGSDSGSAYLFTGSGDNWTQQEKLMASDAASGDQFGYSVIMDGGAVVIGAFGEDTGGSQAGAAYVFALP